MREQVEKLVGRLRQEGEMTSDRLSRIPPEQWHTTVYEQGQPWAIRDVLAHLVAAERGHQQIIGDVASGGPGAPVGLDIDRYNLASVQRLADCPAEQLLLDVAAVREETIRLVGGLEDADLERRGRHPVLGDNALLADMIRLVPLHVRLHLKDLQRALTD